MGERDGRKAEIAGCGEEGVKEEKEGAWRKWKGKRNEEVGGKKRTGRIEKKEAVKRKRRKIGVE